MYSYKKMVPARTLEMTDRFGRPYQVNFDAYEATVVPTLAEVHKRMWADYGPLLVTWKHGWLCPFHHDAGRKRITCSAGLRSTSFCGGLLIHESCLPNYPTEQERLFYLNRVICYKWAHKLGDAYWDIPTAEFMEQPDDADAVFTWCLHRVYSDAGWYDWVNRLSRA